MSEWFPLDLEITKPHPGHEAHLCMAHNVGFVKNNLQEYKKSVRVKRKLPIVYRLQLPTSLYELQRDKAAQHIEASIKRNQ